MKENKTEQEAAITELRKTLKPYDEIYTKILHVSRSGMYRVMDLYIMRKNQPVRLTHTICKALTHCKYDRRHQGLGVSGCGMDMGFAVVYDLSRALFPKGFKVKEKYGRNGDTSGYDKDGGYALKQRWF